MKVFQKILAIIVTLAVGYFTFCKLEKCVAEDNARRTECEKICLPLGMAYCPNDRSAPVVCDNRFLLKNPKDQ